MTRSWSESDALLLEKGRVVREVAIDSFDPAAAP